MLCLPQTYSHTGSYNCLLSLVGQLFSGHYQRIAGHPALALHLSLFYVPPQVLTNLHQLCLATIQCFTGLPC